MGQNPNIMQSGQHDYKFYSDLWATITNGQAWNGTLVNRRKDGTLYYEEASIFPVQGANDQIMNYATVKRDITERVRAEEQLRLLATAIESSDEGVIITGSRLEAPGPEILFVNDGLCRMSGYMRYELLGQTPRIFYGPASNRAALADLGGTLARGDTYQGENIVYRKRRFYISSRMGYISCLW
jgi:PAS domain S-box-containing protein